MAIRPAIRTLSATVVTAAGAALIGGALAFAPTGFAAPGTDTAPPCVAEGTCALLTPKPAPRYQELTPKPAPAQFAPLTPAQAAQ
ncbi:hypothetical protein [Mycolicibacterium sp.]|uniref:hypothetical protein n=1 Tax=Mycolicibacterium sp. TaxID=2320850 RepID=UPI0028AB8551|nr:hypothetical protein [Mycolicibacterium sp.]